MVRQQRNNPPKFFNMTSNTLITIISSALYAHKLTVNWLYSLSNVLQMYCKCTVVCRVQWPMLTQPKVLQCTTVSKVWYTYHPENWPSTVHPSHPSHPSQSLLSFLPFCIRVHSVLTCTVQKYLCRKTRLPPTEFPWIPLNFWKKFNKISPPIRPSQFKIISLIVVYSTVWSVWFVQPIFCRTNKTDWLFANGQPRGSSCDFPFVQRKMVSRIIIRRGVL